MLATPNADRALAHSIPQGSQTLSEAPGAGELFFSTSLGTLADDGSLTWDADEGPPVSLTDLLAANPDSDVSDAADQLAALEIGEYLDFGGGAAPLGRITRVDPLVAFLANLKISIERSHPAPVYGPFPAARFPNYELNAWHTAVAYVVEHGGWMRSRRPDPENDPLYVIHEVYGCDPSDVRPVAPSTPLPPMGHEDGVYGFFGARRRWPTLDAVNAELVVDALGTVR